MSNDEGVDEGYTGRSAPNYAACIAWQVRTAQVRLLCAETARLGRLQGWALVSPATRSIDCKLDFLILQFVMLNCRPSHLRATLGSPKNLKNKVWIVSCRQVQPQ